MLHHKVPHFSLQDEAVHRTILSNSKDFPRLEGHAVSNKNLSINQSVIMFLHDAGEEQSYSRPVRIHSSYSIVVFYRTTVLSSKSLNYQMCISMNIRHLYIYFPSWVSHILHKKTYDYVKQQSEDREEYQTK